MTALIEDRLRSTRTVKHDLRPVAADTKGYKGGSVMCITAGTSKGFYCPADAAKTGVVVGSFDEDYDNTGGGDGDVTVNVEFARERTIEILDNDTGTAVVAADRESPCYALDDQTVTKAVNSVPAGVVYDVDSQGVHVEIDAQPSPASEPSELVQHLSIDVPLATIQAKTSGAAFNIGAALPANAQVLSAHINVVEEVGGGTISDATATVQNTGETAGALIASTDVFTATGDFKEAGSNPYPTRGGQQLQMTLTATGDTLAHATAGHLKVELFYAVVA